MTPRKCTGFLIDPVARAVGPVEIESDNLQQYYQLLGCELVEVQTIDALHVVFVDEEGLLREAPDYFRIGHRQPLAGRGLVLGVDRRGRSVSATIPIAHLWAMLSFPEAAGILTISGWPL